MSHVMNVLMVFVTVYIQRGSISDENIVSLNKCI